MNEKQAYRAVAALVTERPQWVPVLEAVLKVAERVEPYGGEFAGAWVLEELGKQSGNPTWLPNLRLLVSYGLIEKAGDSVRGGRRAYYRCPGAKAIGRALSRTPPIADEPATPLKGKAARFRFIASGSSGDPGSETARGAGEVSYQPRSWR